MSNPWWGNLTRHVEIELTPARPEPEPITDEDLFPDATEEELRTLPTLEDLNKQDREKNKS